MWVICRSVWFCGSIVSNVLVKISYRRCVHFSVGSSRGISNCVGPRVIFLSKFIETNIWLFLKAEYTLILVLMRSHVLDDSPSQMRFNYLYVCKEMCPQRCTWFKQIKLEFHNPCHYPCGHTFWDQGEFVAVIRNV